MTTSWYLRKPDGTIYGPVPVEELLEWAMDGRVAPDDMLSRDEADWMPAPELAGLDMDCLICFRSGVDYGPMHRRALCDLLVDGELELDEPVLDMRDRQTVPAALLALRAMMAHTPRSADAAVEAESGEPTARQAAGETEQLRRAVSAAEQARDRLQQERASLQAELDALQETAARPTPGSVATDQSAAAERTAADRRVITDQQAKIRQLESALKAAQQGGATTPQRSPSAGSPPPAATVPVVRSVLARTKERTLAAQAAAGRKQIQRAEWMREARPQPARPTAKPRRAR